MKAAVSPRDDALIYNDLSLLFEGKQQRKTFFKARSAHASERGFSWGRSSDFICNNNNNNNNNNDFSLVAATRAGLPRSPRKIHTNTNLNCPSFRLTSAASSSGFRGRKRFHNKKESGILSRAIHHAYAPEPTLGRRRRRVVTHIGAHASAYQLRASAGFCSLSTLFDRENCGGGDGRKRSLLVMPGKYIDLQPAYSAHIHTEREALCARSLAV